MTKRDRDWRPQISGANARKAYPVCWMSAHRCSSLLDAQLTHQPAGQSEMKKAASCGLVVFSKKQRNECWKRQGFSATPPFKWPLRVAAAANRCLFSLNRLVDGLGD